MRYTTTIEIDKPLDEVVALFDNIENYEHWMTGLQDFQVIDGQPGHEGTKVKYRFKMGNREIGMIEVVEKRDLPNEYKVSYYTKGVRNTVKNIFEKIDSASTKYTTENEFHFEGFMKLLGFLLPNLFKKQSLKYQVDFKKFVENK